LKSVTNTASLIPETLPGYKSSVILKNIEVATRPDNTDGLNELKEEERNENEDNDEGLYSTSFTCIY
jgi:hypothetical protein